MDRARFHGDVLGYKCSKCFSSNVAVAFNNSGWCLNELRGWLIKHSCDLNNMPGSDIDTYTYAQNTQPPTWQDLCVFYACKVLPTHEGE